MSNRTTGAAGTHKAEIADEQRWMSVVFPQGEEADFVLDMISMSGPDAAIRHLSQWDYGDETRDAALVILDCLIRRGYLTAEREDYLDMIHAMRP